MKVLLQKNLDGIGQIGDVVEVKPGHARNYLLPQGLAAKPTKANIRAIAAAREAYLLELAKVRTELEAKAAVVEGKELTIEARANEEGHLYGSIGPAQIVAMLAEQNVFIEAGQIELEHPLRELGRFDVAVRFTADVAATIHVAISSADHPDEGADDQADEADQQGQTDTDDAADDADE